MKETMDHIKQEMLIIHDFATRIPHQSLPLEGPAQRLKEDVAFIREWLHEGPHTRIEAIKNKFSGLEDRVEGSVEKAERGRN